MAWVEVHQSLWDHRKTLAVADALDLPELYAAAHMIALWTWTMDNAPNGTFPVTVTSRIIARGAKWTGNPDVFVQALMDAGFLEYTASGQVHVHNWEQYGGKLNAQRQANAERQKRHRDRQKEQQDVTSQADATPPESDVTVTSPLRNAPEKSREEKNREDTTGDIPPSPPSPPTRKPRAQRKSTDALIPDDFTLTPERMAYAAKNGMTPATAETEFETLRNWAESKAVRKASWDATWRTWVLRRKKEREDAGSQNGRLMTSANGRASPFEKTRAAFAEVDAALDDWIAQQSRPDAIETTGRRHA